MSKHVSLQTSSLNKGRKSLNLHHFPVTCLWYSVTVAIGAAALTPSSVFVNVMSLIITVALQMLTFLLKLIMFSLYVASTARLRDPSSRVLLWVSSFCDFPDPDPYQMMGTTKGIPVFDSDLVQSMTVDAGPEANCPFCPQRESFTRWRGVNNPCSKRRRDVLIHFFAFWGRARIEAISGGTGS